jgi:hypothetical protein
MAFARMLTSAGALACGVMLAVTGCVKGTGEGALVVHTYPVPGEVIVDGKNLGAAPVSIAVTGDHTVSFSDLGSQYEMPTEQKVRVAAKDTTVITGTYRNRFVPSQPPEGFSPADSLFVYGTKERVLKDGTIYDAIDGGAMMYLRHGFRENTHVVYHGPGQTVLTLDIYDMGSSQGAADGFGDPEICPENHGAADIGAPCKTYHFAPDYFLYFHKANFLVNVAVNNDSLKSAVDSFAARVSGNIP